MKGILYQLLGLALTAITGIRLEGGDLVLSVRPRKGRGLRCPECGRRCARYDAGRGARRWRALDLASAKCFLEYAPRRVSCPEHGVRVEAVPWAPDPRSRFTGAFEDQVAWLAARCDTSTVAELMRVDWHTVGGICARAEARLEAARGSSRLDGLRRIGIDETSYTKGHRYLTVVVDHDRGCVVWCAKGRDRATLESFFELLGPERCAAVEVVTRDGAGWIADVVAERCPAAEQVMDPFRAVKWVADALNEVKRRGWREAAAAAREARAAAPKRGRGRPRKGEGRPELAAKARADAVRGSTYALLKNPEDLTEGQARTLEAIAREDGGLWRAYNLKERFRDVFKSETREVAEARLDSWLSWAQRCRIPEMVKAQASVRRRREAILRSVELGISNARVEAINNKIKVTQRMAYGFRNIDNLMALIMLRCSDMRPKLPGRAMPEAA